MAPVTTFRGLVRASLMTTLVVSVCTCAPHSMVGTSAFPTPAGRAAGQPTAPVVVGGIEIEPKCEPAPDGEDPAPFFSTLITGGLATRVLREDPAFPSDYCPEDALWATDGGPLPRATGTIGDWTWRHPGLCALPGRILWAMHDIQADTGTISVLEETQVIFPDGCEPGQTCSAPLRFDGRFTVQGGTGRYEQARGVWRGVGRQRGDGTSAVVLCGWLDYAGS